MPHPADTNWGDRSYSLYGGRQRNHTLHMKDAQVNDQGNEPTARSSDLAVAEAGLS